MTSCWKLYLLTVHTCMYLRNMTSLMRVFVMFWFVLQIRGNDDPITLGFRLPAFSIIERFASTTTHFLLDITGSNFSTFDFWAISESITANDPDDYIMTKTKYTVTSGTEVTSIKVKIFNDDVAEELESFRLTLYNATNGVVFGAISEIVVNIIDDDGQSYVGFAESTYEIAKNEGAVDVTLVRSGNIAIDTRVDVDVTAMSSINSNRSMLFNMTVDFGLLETSKTVGIEITQGTTNMYEFLELKISSTSYSTTLQNNSTFIYFKDNDVPSYVTCNPCVVRVKESDDTASITFNRLGNLDREHYIHIKTIDITTSTDDYEYLDGNVTFSRNESLKILVINITDDSDVEDLEESFQVTITNCSRSLTILNETVTIIITDNDDTIDAVNVVIIIATVTGAVAVFLLGTSIASLIIWAKKWHIKNIIDNTPP